MRIRNILAVIFLFATLVPSVIFGTWSYNHGVKKEFDEVRDHHLLIARNLSESLQRYHGDLVASFETIATALLSGKSLPEFNTLMKKLDLRVVFIVDEKDGKILMNSDRGVYLEHYKISLDKLEALQSIAFENKTTFSTVMEGFDQGNKIDATHGNELYAVRRYGSYIAVAVVGTSYFVNIGKTVSFGEKGHTAIVDHEGNVLSHPNPNWIVQRKNIAKVSAVRRMMNGETGIEQFYSPALKADMIAGLTTVKGPGWGVMVPQPVSEIYDKVFENNLSMFAIMITGLTIACFCGLLIMNSLISPLEKIVATMRENARNKELKNNMVWSGILPVKELFDLQKNYNLLANRVSRANKKIENLAFTDSVTGLPNRELFQKIMNDAVVHCPEGNVRGSLFFVDLDNFKEINDVYGHDVGDDFLRVCASKLKSIVQQFRSENPALQIRDTVVARIGGDEFTILVPGLSKKKDAERFLENLRAELARPSDKMSFISDCSASIGCAQYPADAENPEDLIRRADVAMYNAKKNGKNRSCIYSQAIGLQTAAEMRRDLTIAMKEDQLYLEYQPKIDAATNKICGVEALVRWKHPQLGVLNPDIWLPAIYNTPVIGQLGEWVAECAMRDHAGWQESGHNLKIAVNIGSKHFIAPGFVDKLINISKRNAFDTSCMEIEVTEDALFASAERANDVLNRLCEMGFTIAIDDFGKGYSNISKLAQLPFHVIKLDKSIIMEAPENPRVQVIMESIIKMANDLECQTVAEGVESLAQVEFSREKGVSILQGYYFSESKTADNLLEWIEEREGNPVDEMQMQISRQLNQMRQ